MKNKNLIVFGLILFVIAIFIGIRFIDNNKEIKQKEEYYTFREDVLDEVYFPVMHDAAAIYEEINHTPRIDTWYLDDGGRERNKDILHRLDEAKNSIETYHLTNPDAVELKEIVMNNIEIQTKIHEAIKNFEDVEQLGESHVLIPVNEGIDELILGIDAVDANLRNYYTN